MRILLLGAAVIAVLPAAAGAQQPRRQAPIEIRGTVPTPQVVTVRPREVPTYDRRVLVPSFYDHDFWQSILPGYLVVRKQMITGAVPGDSASIRRDSGGPPPPTTMPPASNPPAGSTGAPPPPPPQPPPIEARDGTHPAISGSDARVTPARGERTTIGSAALPPR